MNAAETPPIPATFGLSIVREETPEPQRRIERTNLRSPEEIEDLRQRISQKTAVITVKNAPHFKQEGESLTPGQQLSQQIAELSRQGIRSVIIEGEQEDQRFPKIQNQLDNIWIARFNKYQQKILAVIGGTQSPCEKEQEEIAEQGFAMGLDATLLLPPTELKNDLTALEIHLQRNLNKGPGLLHSDKQKSGFSLPLSVILKLKGHTNFVGVVERDSATRVQELLKAGIHVWVKKFPETTILFQQQNPLLHEIQ